MARTAGRWPVLVGLVAAVALAQSSGWAPGQINATMCSWEQPRIAVLKDTIYMDGGLLYWIPGMSDGSYGAPVGDDNPLGLIWTLNFSTPLSTADNITALMSHRDKVGAASNANNVAPNYYDGALLANDDEFFMYGGLLDETAAYTYPDGDLVSGYQVEQYGAYKESFHPGLVNVDLPSPMTRYVAYGGASSAPSENKAWYFAGLRSPSWGPIYNVNGNDSTTAVNVSNTLISVDMTTQLQETWTNTTLPSSVTGRANPELVWVPVGAQGILVAIGGVTFPEFVSVIAQSTNAAASKNESPAFLTSIDVYDIANKTWYKQPTTGGSAMGQRTRACSVVATAADASSFNIYYYGGFDGLHVGNDFDDDVWVLSLPSFTWTKVYASDKAATHGRAGHKCVKPYPDQMFVVGGYPPLAGSSLSCLGGGIVQLFNLSSATWMDTYSPVDWAEYSVPDAVVKVIGGNGTGGATATSPAATGGWAAPGLKSVFATAYPTKKITTYYPYPLNTTSTPTASPSPTTTGHGGGGHHTPKFLAPLLGVIGGLIVLTVLGLGLFLYRRRQLLKNTLAAEARRSSRADGTGAESEATYDTRSNAVLRWLRAQPSIKQVPPEGQSWDGDGSGKNGASHTTSSPTSPETAQVSLAAASSPANLRPQSTAQSPNGDNAAVELIASQEFVGEMIGDTAHRFELLADIPGSNTSAADTGGQTEVGSAQGYYAKPPVELESPLHSPDPNSTTRNLAAPAAIPRADSPSLGHVMPYSPTPPSAAVTPSSATGAAAFRASTISDLSDQDRRHLRHGSDGGQSVPSAGIVSPLGPMSPAMGFGAAATPPPPPPQPIPETSAGAEAAAEQEAAQEQGQAGPAAPAAEAARPVTPGQTVSATEASPAQSRRSIFRESEADLKG